MRLVDAEALAAHAKAHAKFPMSAEALETLVAAQREIIPTCLHCQWWDPDTEVCCNAESRQRWEFTLPNQTCARYTVWRGDDATSER